VTLQLNVMKNRNFFILILFLLLSCNNKNTQISDKKYFEDKYKEIWDTTTYNYYSKFLIDTYEPSLIASTTSKEITRVLMDYSIYGYYLIFRIEKTNNQPKITIKQIDLNNVILFEATKNINVEIFNNLVLSLNQIDFNNYQFDFKNRADFTDGIWFLLEFNEENSHKALINNYETVDLCVKNILNNILKYSEIKTKYHSNEDSTIVIYYE